MGKTLLLRDGLLTVRLMDEEDAAAVHRCRNLPEVSRYQGWRPTFVADVRRLAREQAQRMPGMQTEPCQLVICLEDAGQNHIAGDFGAGAFDPGRQMEIGIVIDPAWQRRGIAKRATSLLLQHLFSEGLHRVTARVDPRNTPSTCLFDGLGFRREGVARQCYWDSQHQEWTDEVCFAMLASEFAK